MRVDRRIASILETLAQTPTSGEGCSAVSLAQSVNLSVPRTRQLFKRQVGVPLGHFIKTQQMKPVKKLLLTSFLTLKEIMKISGFANADETSFIRGFKKIVGVTPAEFRRRARPSGRSRSHNGDFRKAPYSKKPINNQFCR